MNASYLFMFVTTLVTHFLQQHFGQSSITPFAIHTWVEKLSNREFQDFLLSGSFTNDDSSSPAANDILQSFVTTERVKEINLLPTWKNLQHSLRKLKKKHQYLLPTGIMVTIKPSFNLVLRSSREFSISSVSPSNTVLF